jgi:hypothetical protein
MAVARAVQLVDLMVVVKAMTMEQRLESQWVAEMVDMMVLRKVDSRASLKVVVKVELKVAWLEEYLVER